MGTVQHLRASFAALLLTWAVSGCVQTVPGNQVEAVEALDRELASTRAAEFAPEEYIRFARHWIAFKAKLAAEEDAIRWPWEPNRLEAELRTIQEEGTWAVKVAERNREALRVKAETRVGRLEQRLRDFQMRVNEIEGRAVLGARSIEAELLIRQARSFLENEQYDRSLEAATQASKSLTAQAAVLNAALGRYADEERVGIWRRMVRQTIEWSRTHRAPAIVVSKADRVLILYKNGRKVLSYPVRLGYNGILEKRYQGDGATPEGHYRIVKKRGEGQTQFYRALQLDYPNAEDRRRFQSARRSGDLPAGRGLGGLIEIHGIDNPFMNQTLGCILLDNPHMETLYDRVETGTPVTIVGALNVENSVSLVLADLEESRDSEEET